MFLISQKITDILYYIEETPVKDDLKGVRTMDWNLKITDMSGETPEHSSVIVNFVSAVRHQLKNSSCHVFTDNVQYHFTDAEGNDKIIIPDASINCQMELRRGNTFINAPRFVMEVLSLSTENYDRTEKMDLYR